MTVLPIGSVRLNGTDKLPYFTLNEAAHEKGLYGFPVCGSSNAHEHPLSGPQTCGFLPEASSRFILHICEQQRLW